MKPLPQRKSPRLQGYNYASDGAYFVTICTHERYMWFGDVVDGGAMQLDSLGDLVHHHWLDLPNHFESVELDYFVVMPNHFHGIVVINNPIVHTAHPNNHAITTISSVMKRI